MESEKLDIKIQNFNFVTKDDFEKWKQQLEAQYQQQLSYTASLSVSVLKLENELKEYRKTVENEYIKVPVKMNWFRRLLFRIIFGKDN